MINNNGGQHTVLDRITRITPITGADLAASRRRGFVDMDVSQRVRSGLVSSRRDTMR